MFTTNDFPLPSKLITNSLPVFQFCVVCLRFSL